jgi:hypothetical protein
MAFPSSRPLGDRLIQFRQQAIKQKQGRWQRERGGDAAAMG